MEPRRRRRIMTAVAIVVVVILLVSSVTWYVYWRPWTPRDLLGAEHLQPGTQRDLEGTITSVHVANTTQGTIVWLGLAGEGTCNAIAIGNPTVPYRVGDRFRTTLHFQEYTINGDPAVWAPEAACPFPVTLDAMGTVMDSVSLVAGLVFRLASPADPEWAVYTLFTPNGDRYDPARIPVTVGKMAPLLTGPEDPLLGARVDSAAKWIQYAAVEYARLSAMQVDSPWSFMDSLEEGSSTDGRIRYVDANANGWVDDGDELRVRLERLENETAFQTYLLLTGQPGAQGYGIGYGAGVKYILHGSRGPLEFRPGRDEGFLQLVHESDTVNATVTSTLLVSEVGSPDRLPVADYRVAVLRSDAPLLSGRLDATPQTSSGGVRLDFLDDGDGLLDGGDAFTLSGLENRSAMTLSLRIVADSPPVWSISWFPGYGHVSGRVHAIGLTENSTTRGKVDLWGFGWHPELALNGTARVSLWENGTLVLDGLRLTNGTLGTFANGTLAFADADGDGYLSRGDSLRLSGRSGSRYRAEVSVLFGYRVAGIELVA